MLWFVFDKYGNSATVDADSADAAVDKAINERQVQDYADAAAIREDHI